MCKVLCEVTGRSHFISGRKYHLCWPWVYRCGYRCQECVELISGFSALSPNTFPFALTPPPPSRIVFLYPFVCHSCLARACVSLPDCEHLLVPVLSAPHCQSADYRHATLTSFFAALLHFLLSFFYYPRPLSPGTANTLHPGAKVHLHLCGSLGGECSKGHDLGRGHIVLLAFAAEHVGRSLITRCCLMYQVARPIRAHWWKTVNTAGIAKGNKAKRLSSHHSLTPS